MIFVVGHGMGGVSYLIACGRCLEINITRDRATSDIEMLVNVSDMGILI